MLEVVIARRKDHFGKEKIKEKIRRRGRRDEVIREYQQKY